MKRIDLNRRELAVNGGSPVRTTAWIDNITTGDEEIEAATRVIESGYLSLFEGSYSPDPPFSFSGGPEVQRLEEEWSEYYGANNSIAVNSATSGLYAAIGALGIGFGHEVIVSPYTMTACAMAPMIYGAIPVFADVERESGCLDPSSIESLVSDRTRAILVVHQFGFVANMDRIIAIAQKYDLKIIEDCAQAHGASYNGKPVGTIGDIGVFSLNVNKTIQTGEGGICTTDDDDLAYRLKLIRNHGEAVVGPAEYSDITNIAGFNYRMTEINAAIGRVQLKKLEWLNVTRMRLVERFRRGIEDIPFLSMLRGGDKSTNTFYVVPVRYDQSAAGQSRQAFVKALTAEGVAFSEGYTKPLYFQPAYQNQSLFRHGYPFSAPENVECRTEYGPGTCPIAEKLHFDELILTEHIRPPHTEDDVEDIVRAIRKVADV